MSHSTNFVLGQRWASHTESGLGLGIVIEIDGRRVSLYFPAVDENRTYAIKDAPLSRIQYSAGDTIHTTDGQSHLVLDCTSENGILYYQVQKTAHEKTVVSEVNLEASVRFVTPRQRLFSGQFGGIHSYQLKIQTLLNQYFLQQQQIQGLLGTRTDLIPHQIYIAHEVSQRHHPRVLLADEVGLGKTIEAGMIIHQQLLLGKASRVLIIVPESLQHQWLVEMLRRFNLSFSLFNQNRIESIQEEFASPDPENQIENSDEDDSQLQNKEKLSSSNPFDTAQQIICSLDFLMANSKSRENLLKTQWDMVIIDEVHHIYWGEESSSPEYQFIEQLSQLSPSLLLLTATPEQAGLEGHYARLKLLDPERYPSLDQFKNEIRDYHQINQLITSLMDYKQPLKTEQKSLLTKLLPDSTSTDESNKDKLIQKLLDLYGTGRSLFRNTREHIKNFPERVVHHYPLKANENFESLSRVNVNSKGDMDWDKLLFPEKDMTENWIEYDPRVQWLIDKIKSLKSEKILIICHLKETAKALDKLFNLKAGIRSTCFYEGLSIIERDRSAAYFADHESGAQTLVCSEIGSEGRNFQFAHHLILFDLPMDPDLIEQRIGRLDRIGQKQDIHLHIPFVEEQPSEVMFKWYQEALDIFSQSCSAGFHIFEKFQQQLKQTLLSPEQDFSDFLQEVKTYTLNFKEKMTTGKDRLLELNSFNAQTASSLIENIKTMEDNQRLANYMSSAFDYFGVEQEDHSSDTIIIKPGTHMRETHFPGLKSEGNTLTYNRSVALAREDIEFFSWEHPMVTQVMDNVLNSEMGNATVNSIQVKGLAPGTLLVESWYLVETMAPKWLQLKDYFKQEPHRFLFDIKGKNLSQVVPFEKLNQLCQPLKKRHAQSLVSQIKTQIENILKFPDEEMVVVSRDTIQQSLIRMEKDLDSQKQRLLDLASRNNAIREEEIQHIDHRKMKMKHYLDQATPELQAIRVIINV